MSIETFYDTKMFVIIEKGTFNDHRLRLTYYDYNSTYTPKNCKSVCEWVSKENMWTYECPVRRANNHSMIAWYKSRHQEEIEFSYHDMRSNPNGSVETVKVNNTTGQAYNMNKV